MMGILYGTTFNTSDPQFATMTDDNAILQQWVDLQLRTRAGFYWSTPEIGASLKSYVLRGLTTEQLAAIPAEIENAIGFDERIASVDVTAEQTYTGVGAVALKLKIIVTPKAASVAPFSLTAVASADVVNSIVRGLGAT